LPRRDGEPRTAGDPNVPDSARPLSLGNLTRRRIHREANLRAWISYLRHRFAAAQQA